MAADYEIWLTDDFGRRLSGPFTSALQSNTLWFSASKVVNRIGGFKMGLPGNFDTRLLKPDRMIQIWRQPTGGALALWQVYFIRWWRVALRGSKQIVEIAGPDPKDLLRRRINAHYAAEAESIATAEEIDDLMKRIVTQAIADGANPAPTSGTRVWGNFTIEPDATAGPQTSKDFAFQDLMGRTGSGIIGNLADISRTLANEVFFDVVPTAGPGTIAFEFITRINQPGTDRSDIIFTQERGNLREPELIYDYTSEITYMYASGQGCQDERDIQQVEDTARSAASQWNRCEGYIDARNQTLLGVIEEARAELNANRPRLIFTGVPMDTEGARFGIDWKFGDTVTAKYNNFEFTGIIRALELSMDESGRESVDARIEADVAL